MTPEEQHRYSEATDALTTELEELCSRRPRTVLLEKRIKKLIAKAGWPTHAKSMFGRRR